MTLTDQGSNSVTSNDLLSQTLFSFVTHVSIVLLLFCLGFQLVSLYTSAVTVHFFSLSQRFPLIYGVNYFTFVDVFLLYLFIILEQVSLHTLATTIRFRGNTFLQVLTSFLLSCIDALSSIITGHRGLLFFEE